MTIDETPAPGSRSSDRASSDPQDLLRTSDVAAMFQVSTRTVSEWARRGRLPCMRTPGGQWRYPAGAIRRLVRLAERGVWDAEEPALGTNGAVSVDVGH